MRADENGCNDQLEPSMAVLADACGLHVLMLPQSQGSSQQCPSDIIACPLSAICMESRTCGACP